MNFLDKISPQRIVSQYINFDKVFIKTLCLRTHGRYCQFSLMCLYAGLEQMGLFPFIEQVYGYLSSGVDRRDVAARLDSGEITPVVASPCLPLPLPVRHYGHHTGYSYTYGVWVKMDYNLTLAIKLICDFYGLDVSRFLNHVFWTGIVSKGFGDALDRYIATSQFSSDEA